MIKLAFGGTISLDELREMSKQFYNKDRGKIAFQALPDLLSRISHLEGAAGAWRSMDSAPPSGGVLIVDAQWGVAEATRFTDGSWGIGTFNGTIKKATPLYWQPLPAPPSSGKG